MPRGKRRESAKHHMSYMKKSTRRQQVPAARAAASRIGHRGPAPHQHHHGCDRGRQQSKPTGTPGERLGAPEIAHPPSKDALAASTRWPCLGEEGLREPRPSIDRLRQRLCAEGAPGCARHRDRVTPGGGKDLSLGRTAISTIETSSHIRLYLENRGTRRRKSAAPESNTACRRSCRGEKAVLPDQPYCLTLGKRLRASCKRRPTIPRTRRDKERGLPPSSRLKATAREAAASNDGGVLEQKRLAADIARRNKPGNPDRASAIQPASGMSPVWPHRPDGLRAQPLLGSPDLTEIRGDAEPVRIVDPPMRNYAIGKYATFDHSQHASTISSADVMRSGRGVLSRRLGHGHARSLSRLRASAVSSINRPD